MEKPSCEERGAQLLAEGHICYLTSVFGAVSASKGQLPSRFLPGSGAEPNGKEVGIQASLIHHVEERRHGSRRRQAGEAKTLYTRGNTQAKTSP